MQQSSQQSPLKSSRVVGSPESSKRNTKRYLAGLKPESCSCARNENQLKTTIHSATMCELLPEPKKKNDKYDLSRKYKDHCEAVGSFVLNSQISNLKNGQLRFDLDQLLPDMEAGMLKFIQTCSQITRVHLWSSLVKLEDVQALLATHKPEEANLMHASILSFNERIQKFKRDCPQSPPIPTARSTGFPLSIDAWCNERVIQSLSVHLPRSKVLKEIIICGMNLHISAVKTLNEGLLQAKTLRKLQINFCLSKREQLVALMPALTNPQELPIENLSLAANGLTDAESGELVAKIISMHTIMRDEIIWKYALRNEQPPADRLVGLKQFDLSFNKFGEKAAMAIGKALKADNYLLAINLRSNNFDNDHANVLISYLKDNHTLFNLDLRDNLKLKAKAFRKLAIKLLANYTNMVNFHLQNHVAPNQVAFEDQCTKDARLFDTGLLAVQIPKRMVPKYAKKLEAIKVGSLSEVMASQTNKYHQPARTSRYKNRQILQEIPMSPLSTAPSSNRQTIISRQNQMIMQLQGNQTQQLRTCSLGKSLDSIREETVQNDNQSRETLHLEQMLTETGKTRIKSPQILAQREGCLSHRNPKRSKKDIEQPLQLLKQIHSEKEGNHQAHASNDFLSTQQATTILKNSLNSLSVVDM